MSDTLLSARAQSVRLDRLIGTARRHRRTYLHATWMLLALTWGLGWPVCQWLAARHEAVTQIQPALVSLGTWGAGPLPDYLLLDAMPRWRHGVEINPSTSTTGKAGLYYVPLTLTPREVEEVRVVALGLAPHLLDPKVPGVLKPPFAFKRDPEGLPDAIRKEMARRGVRWAEVVDLVRLIELQDGRVPNKAAASDQLNQTLVTFTGTALSLMTMVMAGVHGWRLRQLQAQGAVPR